MSRLQLMSVAAAAALMTAPAFAQQPAMGSNPSSQTPAGDPTAAPAAPTTPMSDDTATAADPNKPAGDPSMPSDTAARQPSASQPMSQPSGQMDSTSTMGQPAQQPGGSMSSGAMDSGPMPSGSGGAASGMTPADQRGFAPQAPAGMTEEQVVQGDGQLETQTMQEGGGTRTVTSNTPVPNPPARTSSRSPGRGGGR